jgi:hypothetical protein
MPTRNAKRPPKKRRSEKRAGDWLHQVVEKIERTLAGNDKLKIGSTTGTSTSRQSGFSIRARLSILPSRISN